MDEMYFNMSKCNEELISDIETILRTRVGDDLNWYYSSSGRIILNYIKGSLNVGMALIEIEDICKKHNFDCTNLLEN